MNIADFRLSVSSIQDIITYQASLLEGFQKTLDNQNLPYIVSGALEVNFDNVPCSKTTYYSVTLKDLSDPTKILILNIPKEIVYRHQLKGYEYIEALGYIKINFFNNQFSPQFSVLDVKVSAHNHKLVESNKAFSSFFKNIQLNRNNFPYYKELSIAVIVPQSGSSYQEFSRQLNLGGTQHSIKEFPTNIHARESIIKSLNDTLENSANYNILVIIRGGGSKELLNVFDDPELCELVAKFDGYKIIGIGHNRDRVLMELVVDFVTDTPTAAGSHIKGLLNDLANIKTEFVSEETGYLKQQYEQNVSQLLSKNSKAKTLTTRLAIAVVVMFIITSLTSYFAMNKYWQNTQNQVQTISQPTVPANDITDKPHSARTRQNKKSRAIK